VQYLAHGHLRADPTAQPIARSAVVFRIVIRAKDHHAFLQEQVLDPQVGIGESSRSSAPMAIEIHTALTADSKGGVLSQVPTCRAIEGDQRVVRITIGGIIHEPGSVLLGIVHTEQVDPDLAMVSDPKVERAVRLEQGVEIELLLEEEATLRRDVA